MSAAAPKNMIPAASSVRGLNFGKRGCALWVGSWESLCAPMSLPTHVLWQEMLLFHIHVFSYGATLPFRQLLLQLLNFQWGLGPTVSSTACWQLRILVHLSLCQLLFELLYFLVYFRMPLQRVHPCLCLKLGKAYLQHPVLPCKVL